ncbi:MAG TPA: phage holin family protein, partial [Anaerolineae bacterium]|nr:phage holin family protein [Anaerolineae bacterium]
VKEWRASASRSQPAFQPVPDSTEINPLDAIRILRSAGKPLFAQAALHGQLARVEWAEEKNRLMKMLVIALLGFASLLCVMLFLGALLLAYSWETEYRIPAVMALIAVFGLAAGIAWRRLQALSAQSSQAFAATREELAADLALLKSKL